MKTRSIKKKEIESRWFLIDGSNIRLGKLAAKAAVVLMGKNDILKAENLDPMNNVVIINAEKIDLFPTKVKRKMYRRHSGFPGGFSERTYEQMMEKSPEKVVELAVKRMLPQNRMGDAIYKRLKVFKGAEHEFGAQKPVEVKVK